MTDSLPDEVYALMDATRLQRCEALSSGHPVDPEGLAGSAYLGVSMGLPQWVDRLAWKTFVKVFAAVRPGENPTMGWNVRMVQAGLSGPFLPQLDKLGRPKRFGFFQARPMVDTKVFGLSGCHALLDYQVSKNPIMDPTRAVRDPLVSLRPGSLDVLLGRTYLSALGGWLATPSWFVLVRREGLVGLVSG